MKKKIKVFPLKKLPLNKIELADWNYKQDDDERAQKIETALIAEGYITKMVVAEKAEKPGFYEVVDGNHRYPVLQKYEIDEVEVIFLGKLSRPQRQKIGMMLNELQFETDYMKLSQVVKDITEEISLQDLVDITPYEISDLSDMIEMSNYDWDNFLGQPKERRDTTDTESKPKSMGIIKVTCPKCNHEFEYKITNISLV
jgi:hypothetical protein